MQIQVRGHAFEIACAVEDHRGHPGRVGQGAEDGRVALQPFSVEKGDRFHSASSRFKSEVNAQHMPLWTTRKTSRSRAIFLLTGPENTRRPGDGTAPEADNGAAALQGLHLEKLQIVAQNLM